MCGIIGYAGARPLVPILLEGLKRMEYRGYDSAGICVVHPRGLHVVREVGMVSVLEKKDGVAAFDGRIGIGHTRWATHGAPSERNAHPHIDCSGTIAVVHNGIIENADALREHLRKEGHTIRSDTDTEVIAHIIESFYKGDLPAAVREATQILEGAFGLAVVQNDFDGIVVARRGSPLIIGIGKGEHLLASDLTAIVPHTDRVVYLGDEELAIIRANSLEIRAHDGARVSPQVEQVKLSVESIQKGSYKHFMLKEIHEQPLAIENTIRGRVLTDSVKLSIVIPNNLKRIVIVACGTSWHAGLIGKYLIERIAGVQVEVDYASEFRYRDPLVGPGDLVLAISQSGETADTLAAIREAKRKGATTAALVNVVGSTISREVDSGMYLHAGPEIGVASTKAFTCQVTALTILACWIKQQRGEPAPPALLAALRDLPAAVREALKTMEAVSVMAKEFTDTPNFLFLGRGSNFPVALEGALKLKEISYIHAEGYPAAEMKHGPIALIDKSMPAWFVAPHDQSFEKVVSNMEEVRARGGRVLAISTHADPRLTKLAEVVIHVPEVIDELLPIVTVIPLQFFAYFVADAKGLPVDRPRNLAKSVTVE